MESKTKVIVINLDSDVNVPHLADYSHIIQSNAFLSLIDQPTRITSSQTVIGHILTNDSVSTLTPGVIRYKLADHYPTFCIISNSNFKYPRKESFFTFRKLASVNQNNFCNDLFSSLSPLHDRFTLACGNDLSPNAFNDHFTQLISAISAVIDKHGPLQKALRRQKRIQRNPWLTTGPVLGRLDQIGPRTLRGPALAGVPFCTVRYKHGESAKS